MGELARRLPVRARHGELHGVDPDAGPQDVPRDPVPAQVHERVAAEGAPVLAFVESEALLAAAVVLRPEYPVAQAPGVELVRAGEGYEMRDETRLQAHDASRLAFWRRGSRALRLLIVEAA